MDAYKKEGEKLSTTLKNLQKYTENCNTFNKNNIMYSIFDGRFTVAEIIEFQQPPKKET